MMKDFDYTEVEKYLTVSLSRYQIMLPELWEDALQEGMVQAWRDVEAGVEPKLKVLRRAKMRARGYFKDRGEHSFGKPKNSRDGIRVDSSSMDKVQTYLEEFVPVHGRIPKGTEAAQALGISPAAANLALKNIRAGKIDHVKYHVCADGSNRKDWDQYSVTSIQTLESNANRTWEDNADVPFLGINFEEDTVAQMDLINVMKNLNERHREVLYLHLFQQYNTGDIGRHLGYTRNASQLGTKAVQNALNQLRMVIDPYFGECTAGHVRTEDNTIVKKSDRGYSRYCSDCRRMNAAKTNAAR